MVSYRELVQDTHHLQKQSFRNVISELKRVKRMEGRDV